MFGESTLQRSHACEVHIDGIRMDHVSEHHMPNLLRGYACATYRLTHDRSRKPRGWLVLETATVVADRRAHSAQYKCSAHLSCSFDNTRGSLCRTARGR